MEGNDLMSYTGVSQATMFEGVLASPPEKLLQKAQYKRFVSKGDWDAALRLWSPHEMPLKSLADCTNRLGIGTDVYTYLPPESVDGIGRWLVRKGISVGVYAYADLSDLLADFRLNRAVRVLFTTDYDDATLIGPRATMVSPTHAWIV
jgi:hypothetical protein